MLFKYTSHHFTCRLHLAQQYNNLNWPGVTLLTQTSRGTAGFCSSCSFFCGELHFCYPPPLDMAAFVVSTGRRRKNDAQASCRRRLNFKLRSHRIILFYFYYFILFYCSFIGNTGKQDAFVEALKVFEVKRTRVVYT